MIGFGLSKILRHYAGLVMGEEHKRGHHEWCFVLLSRWEKALEMNQVGGGENGDRNLAWNIWDLLNLFHLCILDFIPIVKS